jgi:hypothetical protein
MPLGDGLHLVLAVGVKRREFDSVHPFEDVNRLCWPVVVRAEGV